MSARRMPAAWWAGLAVAAAGAATSAHGLFATALANGQPWAMACLYPVITDGLAIVAYAGTATFARRVHRGYAWAVVVAAAGLSALAQSSYLAGVVSHHPPAELPWGVGCWPPLALAITGHLIHLSRQGRLSDAATTPTPSDNSAPDAVPTPSEPVICAEPAATPQATASELPATPKLVVGEAEAWAPTSSKTTATVAAVVKAGRERQRPLSAREVLTWPEWTCADKDARELARLAKLAYAETGNGHHG